MQSVDTVIAKEIHKGLVNELMAGPGIAMFYGVDDGKIPYWRYTLAIGSSLRVSKDLDVDAKLLWEAKGFKTEWWGVNNQLQQRVRYIQGQETNYLTLAIGLSYFVDCDRRLFINGGFGMSRLIGKWSYTYEYNEEGSVLSRYRGDAQNSFKNYDLGLTCSIGYRRFVVGHMLFTTQLFGNLGLIHVYRDRQHYLGPVRNANLALMIGVGFLHP